MTVIAFDLSLSCTGVAWGHHDSDHFPCPPALSRSPMTGERRHDRMVWWRDTFRALLLPHDNPHIVVEAATIHRVNHSGAVPLVKLHGLLEAVAADNNCASYTEVPPSALKRWATGRGNATKHDMVTAAHARGRTDITDHNEADAWLLWAMATEETPT